MKSIIISFLFFTLICPFLGSYLFLKQELRETKREIKHRLMEEVSVDKLVYFKLSKEQARKNLKWKHDSEFEYHGEMYDVVKQTEENDSVSFWLWWDHKETALNKKLSFLLQQGWEEHQQRKTTSNQLQHFYSTLFLQHYSKTFFIKSPELKKDYSLFEVSLSPYPWIEVKGPPPKYS